MQPRVDERIEKAVERQEHQGGEGVEGFLEAIRSVDPHHGRESHRHPTHDVAEHQQSRPSSQPLVLSMSARSSGIATFRLFTICTKKLRDEQQV